jgi:hypothetical protein
MRVNVRLFIWCAAVSFSPLHFFNEIEILIEQDSCFYSGSLF